jgi:hypothetical protein
MKKKNTKEFLKARRHMKSSKAQTEMARRCRELFMKTESEGVEAKCKELVLFLRDQGSQGTVE